jgi:hypothetical protein
MRDVAVRCRCSLSLFAVAVRCRCSLSLFAVAVRCRWLNQNQRVVAGSIKISFYKTSPYSYTDSTTNKLFLLFALPLATRFHLASPRFHLASPLAFLLSRSLLAARFHLASSLSSRPALASLLAFLSSRSSLSSRPAPRFPLVPLLAFLPPRSYLALRLLLASLFAFVFVSVTCSFLRLILFLQHGIRY